MKFSFSLKSKIILWILAFTLSFGQNTPPPEIGPAASQELVLKNLIDSLHREKNAELRVGLLNEISWNYAVIDFEKGIAFGDSALSLATNLDLKQQKGIALNNIGESLRFSGDIKGSIEKHQLALETFGLINDQSGLADTYSKIGVAYFNLSDFTKALENYNNALEIYERVEDKNGIEKISNHVGILYGTLNQNDKALEFFTKALKYSEEVENKSNIAVNLGNIGLIYEKQNKYQEALNNYLRALKIFKGLGDRLNYSIYLGNAGLVYADLKDFVKAQTYFNQSLSIALQLKDEYGVAYQNGNIGKLNYLMALGRSGKERPGEKEALLEKSVLYFKTAIAKFNELGILDEQKNFLFQLVDAYKEKGDYKNALGAYSKASEIKDSLFTLAGKKQLAELETKQQLITKEKQVAFLSKENEYQGMLSKALIGLLVLIVSILSLIIFFFLRKRKDNRVLLENIRTREEVEAALRIKEAQLEKYQGHLEGLVSERTKELEAEIIERKRAERESIEARDRAEKSDKLKSEFLTQMSHETRTPINIINGFNSILRAELADNISLPARNAMNGLERASNRILRTVDMILKMAEVSSNTADTALTIFDLREKILEELCSKYARISKEKNLTFDFNIETGNTDLYSDEYFVYQIFVNLLDNAVKYTDRGGIKVVLKRNVINQLTATVEDSGIGISKEYFPSLFESFTQEEQGSRRRYDGSGLGLSLVKKYCELINAEILVDSEKGKGSKFTVVFPNQ